MLKFHGGSAAVGLAVGAWEFGHGSVWWVAFAAFALIDWRRILTR